MDFDSKKNYYDDLDVSPTATTEEIRAAYVKLALVHHPDVSTKSSEAEQFVAISDAWRVLSKPELREQYNASRNYPRIGAATYHSAAVDAIELDTHRSSLAAAQRNASSNWREIKSKYKSEKWQNLPLSERKMDRARPVTPLSKGIKTGAAVLFGGAALIVIAYYY